MFPLSEDGPVNNMNIVLKCIRIGSMQKRFSNEVEIVQMLIYCVAMKGFVCGICVGMTLLNGALRL